MTRVPLFLLVVGLCGVVPAAAQSEDGDEARPRHGAEAGTAAGAEAKTPADAETETAAEAEAKTADGDVALQRSVEQLRTSVGRWAVATEFLNDDGSVAKSVSGTYEFSWIVPDRVVAGRSEIPELKQSAGILFYINEKKRQIEMVSVGGDGALWIMTGPLGGEERYSQEFPTADGGQGRLRFTRFNISNDAFESRMEYTDDGGTTWKPGNHQTFRRVGGATP